jgi:hypothetical protein
VRAAVACGLALGALLLAAGLGLLLLGASSAAAAPAPSRLLVEATEFRFTLSRTTVAAGPAIIQLAARGEDPHDLRLVRLDSHGHAAGRPAGVPQTLPGAVSEWRGTLTRGRWKLYCSLPGHEKAGMRAVVTVR